MIELLQYESVDGHCAFADWFGALEPTTAARVTGTLARMGLGNRGDTKSVGRGVLEARLDFGPGYRIYFGQDGERLIILLAGGSKQRQQRDIALSQALWAEYKSRKRRQV
jgi:putative addiction module killer protein